MKNFTGLLNQITRIIVALTLTLIIVSPSFTDILEPGNKAPSFSLPSLSGKRETLRIWCGEKLLKPYINNIPHVVIISFWATYCKPCQKEIPEIETFYNKYKNDKIKVFLISIDEKGAQQVAPFVRKQRFSLPVLFDPYQKTAERYGVKKLPALFIIGPDGIIRYSSVGFKQEKMIGKVLEEVHNAIKSGKQITSKKIPDTQSDSKDKVNDSQIPQAGLPTFTPKQKWHAVARLECGISPDSLALELNVPKTELRKWYNEIKKIAIQIWNEQ